VLGPALRFQAREAVLDACHGVPRAQNVSGAHPSLFIHVPILGEFLPFFAHRLLGALQAFVLGSVFVWQCAYFRSISIFFGFRLPAASSVFVAVSCLARVSFAVSACSVGLDRKRLFSSFAFVY
jgi:hypothetical protein